MKNNISFKFKSKLILLLFTLLSIRAGAVATDPSSAPITLGRWHSDLYKAEAYSQQHDIPMVFIWGSIGCSYCNKMDGYVETQTFKNWMAERQLVMVYIKDYANQSPPEMHYGHDGLNGQIWDFPFVSVYWQSKNAQVYNFVGRYYSSDQDVCAQLLIDQIEDYIAEYSSEPPEGVTIEGPETVLDNSSGEQFTAIYSDAEGNQQDVTSAAQWSVNDPAAASISTSGFFTPADIADGVESDVIVSAVYNPGSGAFTGERLVTVSDSSVPIGTVQGVVIDGPGWLQSGASAGYAAMFIYANGATFAVDAGNSIVWSVTDGPVSIAADGTVTVQSVSSDTSATLNLRVTTPTRKTYYGTLQIAIVTQPPKPEYTLVISGPDAVNEGANVVYTATLTAEGQDDQDVTAQAQWSVSGAAGTVVTAGELTAGQVEMDTPCTITVSYQDIDAEKMIQIVDIPTTSSLVGIEIDGPAVVDEGGSAAYTCTAIYFNESLLDVTGSAQWWSDLPAEQIDGGEFVSGEIESDTNGFIYASYQGYTNSFAVTLINTAAELSLQHQSFESGLADWQLLPADGFSWSIINTPTPSEGTGPAAASAGSSYIYTEASGNTNSIAELHSPAFTVDEIALPFILFDYHMYGVGMGELHVDVFAERRWNMSVWSRNGMQHFGSDESWSEGRVDLSAFASQGSLRIRFRAVTGVNYLSDIAVDNIRLIDFSTVQPSLYEEWVMLGGVDAENADPEDMPQNDGIPNLLKYASGLDAVSYSYTDIMSLSNRADNVRSFLYYKAKNAQDVTLAPLWSYSLSAYWTELGGSVLLDDSGERELWKVDLPEGPAGFMKLRAKPLDDQQ
jgi:hypothetical protein